MLAAPAFKQEPSSVSTYLTEAKDRVTDIIYTYLNVPQGDILAREKATDFFSRIGIKSEEAGVMADNFFSRFSSNPEAVEAVRGCSKQEIETHFTDTLMEQYGPILSLLDNLTKKR